MKKELLEPLGLLAFILVLLKLCGPVFPVSWQAFLTPTLLLYAPLAIYIFRKRPILFIDRNFPQFLKGVSAFVIVSVIVFPPYFIVAHYWMLEVFGYKAFQAAPVMMIAKNSIIQILLVALPEEFFFRGFFQERLDQIFKPRWKFLGIQFGWGLILTSLVFAFAHSIIQVQWWHFSIFFPALLFGYLKERTGSITAPILFHAFCNVFTGWFVTSYY